MMGDIVYYGPQCYVWGEELPHGVLAARLRVLNLVLWWNIRSLYTSFFGVRSMYKSHYIGFNLENGARKQILQTYTGIARFKAYAE